MRWYLVGFLVFWGFVVWLAFGKSKAADRVRDMISGEAFKGGDT